MRLADTNELARVGGLCSGVAGILLLMQSVCFAATATEYINDARIYLGKGDKNSAVIQLKNALQREPYDAEARLMLGGIYIEMGDGLSAEKELNHVRQLKVPKERWLALVGKAYLLQGRFNEVIKTTEAVDDLSPETKAQIHVLRGSAYLGLKALDRAAESFDLAIGMMPKSTDALIGKARVAAVNNKLDDAAKYAGQAVAIDPRSAEGWMISGEIARVRKDYAVSRADFQKALQISPGNEHALLGYGIASVSLGEFDVAGRAVDRILKKRPGHPHANYLRAVIAFQKKDFSAAEESLRQVMRVMPDHRDGLRLLGIVYYARGRFESADDVLGRYLHAAPDDMAMQKLYGVIKLRLKQPDPAIKNLEAGLKKNPKDAQLLSLLGAAYMQKGDRAKGMSYMEKAVEAAPDVPDFHTRLGFGYLAAGEMGEAVSELESAVRLEKEVVQTDVILTVAYIKKGDFEKAYRAAKEMAVKQPGNPVILNLIGTAAVGMSRKDEGRRYFVQALKLDPKFTMPQMNLGALSEQENRPDEARDHYRAVLKQDDKDISAMMALARMAEKAGNNSEALQWLEQAWMRNPGVEPGVALTQYYMTHGDGLKALKAARELQTSHPDDPRVLRVLGAAQLMGGEKDSAVVTYGRLVELQPKTAMAHYLLGGALAAKNDLSSARDQFGQAVKIEPDNLLIRLSLADVGIRSGHYAEAMKVAMDLRAEKGAREAMAGYMVEGDVFAAQKQYMRAVEAYESARKYDADNRALLLRLNVAKQRAGDDNGGMEILSDWLRSHPDDMDIRAILAMAYQSNGKIDPAISQYEQILAKQPNHAIALNNLAWLYQERGDTRALKYAERVYDLVPDSPAIADTYGWALVQQGSATKGLSVLQKAVSKAPHMLEIRYHLAVAMERTGKKLEARTELESLLKDGKKFPQADDAREMLRRLQRL